MPSAPKEDCGKDGCEGTGGARITGNACTLGVLRVPGIPNTSNQQEQRCQDFDWQV